MGQLYLRLGNQPSRVRGEPIPRKGADGKRWQDWALGRAVATGATVNIMDNRAIACMDMGFYIATRIWPILKSSYKTFSLGLKLVAHMSVLKYCHIAGPRMLWFRFQIVIRVPLCNSHKGVSQNQGHLIWTQKSSDPSCKNAKIGASVDRNSCELGTVISHFGQTPTCRFRSIRTSLCRAVRCPIVSG